MEKLRLFAAIRPPDDIIDALTSLQKGLPDARWSAPEKLHLTLGFFGDIEIEQAEMLDSSLGQIRQKPFPVQIGGVGHFGKSDPHAFWAGVEANAPLMSLHKACIKAARVAGITPERRNYQPHITLAYLRRGGQLRALMELERAHSAFKPRAFLADQFFLYSSLPRQKGGNLYRVEASYPLYGNNLIKLKRRL